MNERLAVFTLTTPALSALSLALGIGLLIGLQRQRVGATFGGIRTFPLIALLGAVCGLLAQEWGALIVLAGFVGIATTIVVANMARPEDGPEAASQTTEVAALLTYALGVLLAAGLYAPAVVIGGVTAVLLHLKQPMHAFAGKLREHDLHAVMRFAIVSLIILPLLPDRAYGPYEVLNPREIWWMVTLIVGIGLAGYVSYRVFGERAGTVLGGILGGLISSTATTVAYARRVRQTPAAVGLAAATILIASTVAVVRVIVEITAVAPQIVLEVAPPLGALCLVLALVSAATLHRANRNAEQMPEQTNPAELRGALLFGALYALVIFAIAAAQDWFGSGALYVVAVLAGLVDVDAITLSTSRLAAADRLDTTAAWRIILIASLANLFFKTVFAALLGGKTLLLRLAVPIAVALAGGGAILVFWPAG